MREAKNYFTLFSLFALCIAALIYGYIQVVKIPTNFPHNQLFMVNENESLKSISNRLENEGYIISPILFRAGISFLEKDRNIQVGGYLFSQEESLLGVLHKFAQGKTDAPLASVTIPEGSTLSSIVASMRLVLPNLSSVTFVDHVNEKGLMGKLFPSTYFLLPSYKEEDIIFLMVNTFHEKTKMIFKSSTIKSPLNNEQDVLILASILEGEAKTEKDMKIIAGILLTRLTINMPLQVDVAKETYKQKGLPKEPLNNPGLVAINAVLNPTASSYLFYITGNDGNMYYAKTFIEHKRNIQKYLK